MTDDPPGPDTVGSADSFAGPAAGPAAAGRRPGPGDWARLGRGALLGLDPAMAGRLSRFRAAVEAADRVQPRPSGPALVGGGRSVGVIGLSPGEGRSSIAALLALTAAGFAGQRVVVVDTPAASFSTGTGSGGGEPPGRTAGHRAGEGRTVTELLGGRPASGRLDRLLTVPEDRPVSRAWVASSVTPGTAVPVLGLSPRHSGFSPQLLEQTLVRLSYRADLVVIDTPPATGAPVLHAVLASVDHLVLVARADREVERRLAAIAEWLDRAPGRPGFAGTSVVLVPPARWNRRPRARAGRLVVPYSGRLRAGRPGTALGSRLTSTGLELYARVMGSPAVAGQSGVGASGR